jgi:parallel beta-helix repeat protein
MKINNNLKLAAAIATGIALVGCGSDDNKAVDTSGYSETVMDTACFAADTCSASAYTFPEGAVFVAADAPDGSDITDALSEALFAAQSITDATVVLPKGSFKVNATMTVTGANGLTVTGHGIKSTILDFTDATEANDGVRFEGGSDITIRDVSVNEAKKNGIKAVTVTGIRFNYVATVWQAELTVDTVSAYGIYPVESSHVLVENSYAKGSNDAGIYVGQSNNIVVRNNIADYNIAGIEIENSNNADVYNNLAYKNSGGILSFDLPGLTQAAGTNIRIFSNEVYDNNTLNVGHGTVGEVPAGTGMLVLATNDVEIYNNNIYDNRTEAIAIVSYFMLDQEFANYAGPTDPNVSLTEGAGKWFATMANAPYYDFVGGWTPTTRNVSFHDNVLTDNSLTPIFEGPFVDVVLGYLTGNNATGVAQPNPAIVYDGLGELVANAGLLVGLGNMPYADSSDYNCAFDNEVIITNNSATSIIGSVFGVNPSEVDDNGIPTNFVQSVENGAYDTPNPTLRVSSIDDESTILNCATTPTRLSASTVTIAGVSYGCEADDADLAACAL